MSNRQPSILDVIESFLLGLSCLIGGDQFYILLSHTTVSRKFQYYSLLFFVVLTFVISAIFDCHSDLCVNGAHLCYVTLLGIIVFFVKQKIKSSFIVTILTPIMGVVITYLIIQAFTRYSRTRRYLQSFLLGLFSSRVLPNFIWYFYKRRYIEHWSHLHSVSLTLITARFALCLISMLIKVGKRKFEFSNKQATRLLSNASEYATFGGYSIFLNFCKKVRICLIPLCILIVSISLYLTFPPTLLATHFNYSSNFTSSISFLEMTFHLLGCCFGIAFPVSKTGNDLSFYFITLFFYIIYFNSLAMYYYLKQTFSHHFMYLMVMASGFSLGYLTTYTLHIVYNTTLTQTCISKEYSTKHCCCSKFFSECYCRFLKLIGDVDKTMTFIGMNRFDCHKVKSHGKRNFIYSKDGDHAVIICSPSTKINGNVIVEKSCEQSSATCPCLKLVGIYVLESVTASTCDNCQLSVRLEASSVDIEEDVIRFGRQHSGGECESKCSTCCFTIDCCSICTKKTTTKFKCCRNCRTVCEHVNKPDHREPANIEKTRVFFLYSKGDKVYFREISPYTMPEFDGDLRIQNEFLIRGMDISSCCHADLQVDLHCGMKNNFFRLTQIEYKNKTLKIESLTFTSKKFEDKIPDVQPKEPEVPKTPEVPKVPDICCCENSRFSKLTVKYRLPENEEYLKNEDLRQLVNQQEIQSEDESCKCSDKCTSNCGCCRKGKGSGCCCCLIYKLDVDPVSSFIKRIDTVRVRLVCSTFIILSAVCLLVVLALFSLRNRITVPYTFDAAISYKDLVRTVDQYRLRSNSQMESLMHQAMTYCRQGGAKKSELSYMLRLFSCVLNPHDYNLVNKYMEKQATSFISHAKKNYKVDAINWCLCSGLMFAYLASVFSPIQSFFSYWEELWQGEYLDYMRNMSPLINKISHKSKFALSLLSEVKITEQEINLINRTRLLTWNEVLDELKRYTELYSEEANLIEEGLPLKFDLRLLHFLDRWSHRVNHIKYLISTQRSIFDWKPFLSQYENFKLWHRFFRMFIERFEEIVSLPVRELNRNTSVFANYKI